MKRNYHTIEKQGKVNAQKLGEFLSKSGQQLLPMVDLIEQCRMACDELIDVAGRATIQAVLELSAQQVAGGPRQQGKQRTGEVVWYGQQSGQVMLSDRKLAVQRPRLRQKGPGADKEVEIPAYVAMQDEPRLGARMLDILMRGVSTRQYRAVIPEMADTVGVSRSSVSRQMIEASEAEVEALLGRRFDEVKLVIIYIDGMVFGDHTDDRRCRGGCGRPQACAGHPRRSHGKCHRRQGTTGRSGHAWGESGTEAAVCDRRLEGVARGHQRGIWKSSGATVPRPQTAQCDGSLAGRPEGPSEVGDAGSLAAGCQGRHGADEKAGRVVGTRLSFCRSQSERRTGGVLYHQPAGCAALAASLLGHH